MFAGFTGRARAGPEGVVAAGVPPTGVTLTPPRPPGTGACVGEGPAFFVFAGGRGALRLLRGRRLGAMPAGVRSSRAVCVRAVRWPAPLRRPARSLSRASSLPLRGSPEPCSTAADAASALVADSCPPASPRRPAAAPACAEPQRDQSRRRERGGLDRRSGPPIRGRRLPSGARSVRRMPSATVPPRAPGGSVRARSVCTCAESARSRLAACCEVIRPLEAAAHPVAPSQPQ